MESPTTEDDAYTHLGIRDHNISDGDVVACFYAQYRAHPENLRRPPSEGSPSCTRALELIAARRQSRLLAFALTVIPQLNDNNVGLLSHAPLLSIPPGRAAESRIQNTVPSVAIKNGSIIDLTQVNAMDTFTTVPGRDGHLQDSGQSSAERQMISPAVNGSDENRSSDNVTLEAESVSSADIPSSSEDFMSSSSDGEDKESKYYDGQR
ncbi:MAG: hypothetical protein L6R40_000949 [Gallowayella cf. fulva]|nr:MAG: hypothetical protein L6R40_000949 [Xanthomendoza cf. fulva]